MIRRFNIKKDKVYINLHDKIHKYSNTIIDPSIISTLPVNVYKNSWYHNSCIQYSSPYIHNNINLVDAQKKANDFRTKKIDIILTQQQKDIFAFWFDASARVFNLAIVELRKLLPYSDIYKHNNYRKYYAQYSENNKKIKTYTKLIDNLRLKYASYLLKLDELCNTANKNSSIHKKINSTKINIYQTKKHIAENNININNLAQCNNKILPYCDEYTRICKNIDTFLNYKYIRTYVLKDKRDNIANKYSCYNNDKNFKVHAHTLDCAIKKACASYKTCIELLSQKLIYRFRVKCKSLQKDRKCIDFDSTSLTFDDINNCYHLCENKLGKINYLYNNKNYKITESKMCSVLYDGGKYKLLLPVSIEKHYNTVKKPYIALDGGCRDFLTGFTCDSVIKYCHNAKNTFCEYYKKIDVLNKYINKNIDYNKHIDIAKKQIIDIEKSNTNSTKNKNKIENLQEKLQYYDDEQKKEKYTIQLEIEQSNSILKNYSNILCKLEEKYKETSTKYYEMRIHKVKKLILKKQTRINKLENIDKKEKNKNKYEKYMNYRKLEKVKYYNKKIIWKVEDMHWKIARELSINYETIILGQININSIMKSKELTKETKRVLQSLSHYKFRERLVYKALSLGSKVIIANEKYTTKMCGLCGYYNGKIKGEHTIKCEGCKKEYDRDISASQCIYMSMLE